MKKEAYVKSDNYQTTINYNRKTYIMMLYS